MPHLKELLAKYGNQGLVVLGVHTTRSSDEMAAFAQEQKLTWPVAVDEDGRTVKAYAVDSFPDYYLVDRAGKLRVADLANSAVDAAVEKLLAEPVPAGGKRNAAAGRKDARQLFTAALADAKQSGRKVLLHVHGPG